MPPQSLGSPPPFGSRKGWQSESCGFGDTMSPNLQGPPPLLAQGKDGRADPVNEESRCLLIHMVLPALAQENGGFLNVSGIHVESPPHSERVDMSFYTIMQLRACMKHRCLYNRVSIRVPALCRSLPCASYCI